MWGFHFGWESGSMIQKRLYSVQKGVAGAYGEEMQLGSAWGLTAPALLVRVRL